MTGHTQRSSEQIATEVADNLGGGHRKAIEAMAAEVELSFDELMAAAKIFLTSGEYLPMGDNDVNLPDEFWDHYEWLTNQKIEEDKKYSFFSCAC